jgi:hypothetical protein
MSTAPNALSQLKAKLKGLLKSKKADKPAETTKPADTATKPTEAAAAEAAADPVAAAARKYFAVLPAYDPALHQPSYVVLFSTEDTTGEVGRLWIKADAGLCS